MPEAIDVIAQWNADGSIEPRRVQIHTDEGAEPYTIQSSVPITHSTGEVHGKYITKDTLVWECTVVVRGVKRVVYLFFDGRKWGMSYSESA